MSIKSIPTSVKISFLIIIIVIIILFVLPRDGSGNICGNSSIPPFIFLLMIILAILAMIDFKRKKISIATFIMILIPLALLLFIILFVSVSPNRSRARGAATKSNMTQLMLAQEMFYEVNHRYADAQEELIGAELFNVKLKNRTTNKELTDRDGEGIEGGDNNPETWSVTAYIPHREINKWCRVVSEGYWYVCNQNGCQKE